MNLRILYLLAFSALIAAGCGTVPVKQYYMLNYMPSQMQKRQSPTPYPVTIRLREFDIEEAYNRPQIVYRQSPFQLKYYVYRVWAVKPARMITDLVHKHLASSGLVNNVVRRFDESHKPHYELSGIIEALEEYDSDELWFAHLAYRINLVRISDGGIVYTKRFDLRKKVYQHEPEFVIREMSAIMELSMAQVINDMDIKLAQDLGIGTPVSGIETPEFQDTTIIEVRN
ncbi:MAG: hypothetical protein GX556_15775 [Fibrobacter sp.]|nr:hypothetical protein [Fibrobacter sp.]